MENRKAMTEIDCSDLPFDDLANTKGQVGTGSETFNELFQEHKCNGRMHRSYLL